MRPLLVALALLTSSAGGQPIELTIDEVKSFSAFRVPSEAMEPTIRPGEFVLIDAKRFQRSALRPGQIIAFKQPPDGAYLTIKRFIALPGSTVQFRRWKLYVDNKGLKEPYVSPDNVMTTNSFEWGPVTLSTNCVFVLSDNRDMGNDSRKYGCVSLDAILGVARYVTSLEAPQRARQLQ